MNQKIYSVSEYIEYMIETKTVGGLTCYRGQAEWGWQPTPGVYRDGVAENVEEASIRELISESPEHFRHDHLMFEKLVRAQHYQLPTRLLDVSMNPLVSLYFACLGAKDKDGEVFSLVFTEDKRILQFDSDKVSILANLSRLNHQERQKIQNYLGKKNTEKYGRVSSFKFKTWFNRQPEVKRLVQFVRVEKPYFLNEIKPGDLQRYFFVWPKKSNQRLVAQSGAFIASGLLKFKRLSSSTAIKFERFRVPSEKKGELLEQLDALNINGRTLFPEIENVSQYIRERYVSKSK